jgi:hypothetical protein
LILRGVDDDATLELGGEEVRVLVDNG